MSWSLRSHWLWYRDDGLVAYAFVLGDHLSAEEKNQGSILYTEQHRDRGRKVALIAALYFGREVLVPIALALC